ncbi:endonuclease V [Candidatus Bathyarchaeota archaeon]|nr:endonuclease V [Candidatus Bathyarchaeota archaeon]
MTFMTRVDALLKYPASVKSAIKLQEQFAHMVSLIPRKVPPTITGIDLSYSTQSLKNDISRAVAAAVTVRLPSLEPVETAIASGTIPFPYVPGCLGFREVPLAAAAIEKLDNDPCVILFDGHGIAHPRKFGAASHCGLALGIPSIGCAKSAFTTTQTCQIAMEQFASQPSWLRKQVVGHAIRMAEGVNPVFMSPGHLVDMASALQIMRCCSSGFRVPQPIRLAHEAAGREKKQLSSSPPRDWLDPLP